MTLLPILEWLETTQVAVLVRESQWGFQVVVALHLLGLSVSVGMLIWFDLRLLGLSMRNIRVSEVYRRVSPWLLTGFAVMFITGGMLFIAFATSAYANVYFRIKAFAILLAGVNALLYHVTTERTIGGWDDAARPPLPARLAGLTSIVVWTVVILAGRMMSYTVF